MFVVWLTGISGAGKTTIGKALHGNMHRLGKRVEFLDGDEVREFFGGGLGYSRQDRIENNKRFIFAAMLLERNDIITIVANIAPYAQIREFARRKLKNYIQVYVKASLSECRRRDVKGHYKRLEAGEINDFVGEDQEYEVPRHPAIVIETERKTVEEAVILIMDYLKQNKYL